MAGPGSAKSLFNNRSPIAHGPASIELSSVMAAWCLCWPTIRVAHQCACDSANESISPSHRCNHNLGSMGPPWKKNSSALFDAPPYPCRFMDCGRQLLQLLRRPGERAYSPWDTPLSPHSIMHWLLESATEIQCGAQRLRDRPNLGRTSDRPVRTRRRSVRLGRPLPGLSVSAILDSLAQTLPDRRF